MVINTLWVPALLTVRPATDAAPWEAQVMAQGVGYLAPTRDTWNVFLDPDLTLAKSWLPWAFGKFKAHKQTK